MIRKPAVAGHFYPADSGALGQMVDAFLRRQTPDPPVPAVAVLSPHAGLNYSGRVAGATYAATDLPRRFLLLGPNHTGLGPPLSVWDHGEWEFPGGVATVDEPLCEALLNACESLVPDREAHRREHCLEVQLPFLARRVPDLRIVPVVVGTSRPQTLTSLGMAVARAVREAEEPVLIVISSDMTHYEPIAQAERKDRLALQRLSALDPEGLLRVVGQERISMCGFAPAMAGLVAAGELGAKAGKLVLYSHSGETSGDYDQVVGYAGMIFS